MARGGPGRSAIVDWSNARHGFGLSADVAIRCDNDDEVVEGVIRAIKAQPGADTGGADFVWGRLRELEYARGWDVPAADHQESGPGETSTAEATWMENDGGGSKLSAVVEAPPSRASPRCIAAMAGPKRGAHRVQRHGGHARVLPGCSGCSSGSGRSTG